MKIIEIKDRTAVLVEQLLKVYVPQALNSVPILAVAENETGKTMGFMGVADKMLEMLFISNESILWRIENVK